MNIKESKNKSENNGSSLMQIFFLNKKIERNKKHLINNKKDFDSERSLLKRISKIKKIQKYLEKNDKEAYKRLKEDIK